MELGRAIPHSILIEPSANKGFIVKIGCGTFVATDVEALIEGLTEYLAGPMELEGRFNEAIGNPPPEPAQMQ